MMPRSWPLPAAVIASTSMHGMGPAGTGAVSRGAAATALAAYTDGTTGISLVITHASTAETPTATGDRSTVETDATAAETSVKTDARRVLMKVVRKGKV